MKYSQRRPDKHFFEHGWIQYSKQEGNLFFQLGIWDEFGKHWVKNQSFEVPNEKFIADISDCLTLKEVMVVIQHFNIKVVQNG